MFSIICRKKQAMELIKMNSNSQVYTILIHIVQRPHKNYIHNEISVSEQLKYS